MWEVRTIAPNTVVVVGNTIPVSTKAVLDKEVGIA